MEIQEILRGCVVEDKVVKLPEGQLDRKLYQQVAKSLTGIGGKWKGGKVMGFVFLSDPTKLLAEIAGGKQINLKKEFQFFGTPYNLAEKMVDLVGILPEDRVLEPSAGQGAIIKALNALHGVVPDCFELMEQNRIILSESGLKFNLVGEDFLKCTEYYDVIVANPPFTKNQDIDHIRKMYDCLAYGGRLISISSRSWVEGSQKRQKEFRQWLDILGASTWDIPEGTFKESGTMVGAVLVSIIKNT